MAADGTIRIDTKLDNSGLTSGLSMLGTLAKRGAQTAVAAIGGVSAAMGGIATYAVKVGTSFEAGMSEVAAISGATASELDSLTEKAKEMGAKTKFSATESAEAFKYMAMAGWQTSDMLNGIDGVMNLAAASGEDLASVSDIVTDALTAFGLQAKDSAHFADVLAQASSRSNTNVGLMGYTFKYVAPVAGALGYSIEDMAVAIGLMANAGIKGEQAGTQLRGVLSRMSLPTEKVQTAMDKLGLSLTDSEGNMKSFAEVMQDMRAGFSKLTDAEKTTYAAMLGGQEAMSGLLAIVGASDEDFNNLTAAIAASDGTAQKMADTMNDNVQGAFTIMKSAAEGFGITVYESMQTPLKELCEEGTVYLEQLTEAFQKGGLSGAVEAAGGMFAEIAAKAAKAAPQMVTAAVSFIKSFVKGINDNRAQLLTAARDIVYALVDGLVSLLPREVQKPVKETVSILKKSFESGGLKEAINTCGTVLKNLGKIVTNISKVVLPPLAKAIDLVGKNAKILIPLVTGVAAAFKAYSIVKQITGYMTALNATILKSGAAHSEEALAAALSTGALTKKQVAVGVLTGKIEIATVKQHLWNIEMSANPIGLLVAAITGAVGLIAAIALLCDSYDSVTAAQEKLDDANEKLGDGFSGIGESAKQAYDDINSAKGILDGFNDSIIVSEEKRQALADEMDSIQSEISEIAKNAAEQRRGYTADEIKRLDELFARMRTLAEQELEIASERQEAAKIMAEQAAADHEMQLAEYKAYSDRVIKSAQETRDATVAAAYEQYTAQLVLAKKACTENGVLNQQRYDQMKEAAKAEYDAAVSGANALYADTMQIINQGYLDRSDAALSFFEASKEQNAALEKEERRYLEEMDSILHNMTLNATQQFDATTDAEKRHKDEQTRIKKEYLANLDEQTQEEVGVWLEQLAAIDLYGGKITEENQRYLNEFLSAYDSLPDEAKKAFSQAMQGMLAGMQEKEPALYAKASSLANGVISRLNKTFEINSPSRKTRKIFRHVVEGGEVGVDEQKPKLMEKVQDTADSVLAAFAFRKADVERASEEIADVPLRLSKRLMDRMRSVAASMTERFTAPIQIRTEQEVSMLSSESEAGTQTGGTADGKPTQVVTHLHINGREFAIATTPYIEEEMAFE